MVFRALSIVFVIACVSLQSAYAGWFTVRSMDVQRNADVFYLNAHLDYALSDQVNEALLNGVPLEFEVTSKVIRIRKWMWNETVQTSTRRYLLRYRALAKHYQTVDLKSGEKAYYKTLARALAMLGNIQQWPVVAVDRLVHKELYQIKLHCQLDIESLPLPLQPTAFFSSDWNLSSDWFVWRLNY